MNAHDLSIVSLITNASLLVQIVMLILVLVSVASWTIIFRKWFAIRWAKSATNAFEGEFWRGAELNGLYQTVSQAKRDPGPLARIFEAGMKEFRRARQKAGNDATSVLESSGRAMRASFQREMDALESSLAFLASAGSVSPYIGLFGTVWGIMIAFRDIGMTGSTSIVAVAPGIAEALINTAAGLGAAIPALVGYNYFAGRTRQLRARMEDFALEFLNLAERNFT
jgi:biopolymer transport protein TolQ